MLTRMTIGSMLCLPICASAQNTFQRQYKSATAAFGAPYNVLSTSDGGFISAVAGTEPGAWPSATLARFDSLGNMLWMKADTVDLTAAFVRVLPRSGGFLFVSDKADFTSDHYYVLRGTDTACAESWRTTYTKNYLQPLCAAMAADSGFLLAGQLNGPDLHLAKTDAEGQLLWSRTYYVPGNGLAFECLSPLPDGGALIGGSYAISWLVDLFLMRVDASGIVVWARSYPHASTIRPDHMSSVIPTTDGGYAMTCLAPVNNDDLIYGELVKLHADGSINWQYTYAGATDITEFNAVLERPDGSFAVCGYGTDPNQNQDLSITHIDSSGSLLWSRNIGMDLVEAGYYIAATEDDGFVMSGTVATSPLLINAYYLVKTDSGGAVGCLDTMFVLTEAPFDLASTPLSLLDSTATLTVGGQVHQYKDLIPLLETPCDFSTDTQDNRSDAAFHIWPNPCSDELHIIGQPKGACAMDLRTLDGRSAVAHAQGITGLSVRDLAPGPYVLTLRSTSWSASRMVIVEH
jgi:hypothetical protein